MPLGTESLLQLIVFYFRHGGDERLAVHLKELPLQDIPEESKVDLDLMRLIYYLRTNQREQAKAVANELIHYHGDESYIPPYVKQVAEPTRPLSTPVTNQTLNFKRLDGTFLARLTLRQGGQIEGSKHPNESYWKWTDHGLTLSDNHRRTTSVLLYDALQGVFCGPYCYGFAVHVMEPVKDA